MPLSHVAANIMDLFMATQCLGTVYFANRDALKGTLVSTLKEALPTVFFGVPRVWEKVQEKMIQVWIKNEKSRKYKTREFRLGRRTLGSRRLLEAGQRRRGWSTTRRSWAGATGPSSPSRLQTRWFSAR